MRSQNLSRRGVKIFRDEDIGLGKEQGAYEACERPESLGTVLSHFIDLRYAFQFLMEGSSIGAAIQGWDVTAVNDG